MKRILILCTGNSCRSQMAEGFLKSFDNSLDVYSAGTKPADRISSKAVLVMKEKGIDISSGTPEDVEKYIKDSFDFVITVCDNAKETCPVFTGDVRERMHIGFEDPAEAEGTEEEVLNFYRRIRDEIETGFLNLYLSRIKPELM
jgi:arsenate reductase (thioredoxin)